MERRQRGEGESVCTVTQSQSSKQRPVMRCVLWAFPRSARGLSCRNRTGSIDCSETKTNTSFDSLDINLDPRVPRNAPGSESRICIFSLFFFLALSIYCWPLKAIWARVLNGIGWGTLLFMKNSRLCSFLQAVAYRRFPRVRHAHPADTPSGALVRALKIQTASFHSPTFSRKEIFPIFMHERRFYISLDKPCSRYVSGNEFTGILSER